VSRDGRETEHGCTRDSASCVRVECGQSKGGLEGMEGMAAHEMGNLGVYTSVAWQEMGPSHEDSETETWLDGLVVPVDTWTVYVPMFIRTPALHTAMYEVRRREGCSNSACASSVCTHGRLGQHG
jgi:hypothetical protein